MSKPKTVGLWDVLASRETLLSVSDAALSKATGVDAVKVETAKVLTEVRAALKGAETPEAFAQVVSSFKATYGSESEMSRMAQATKGAAKVLSAATAVIVREAFTRDMVGHGKHYGTQGALAAAVGVSPGRITQLKPTPKDASKSHKGAGRKSTAPETVTTPSEGSVVPDDVPDDLTALQQALTRLETASLKVVGTPDNAEDIRRIANALDAISRNLRSVAEVAPSEHTG